MKKNPEFPSSIDDLKNDPENPRAITPEALAGLKASLSAFGDLSGITWNKRTGELVCGHQRMRALREQYGDAVILKNDGARAWVEIPAEGGGLEQITVRIVDWPRLMQRQANIAANAPTIQGTFTEHLQPQLVEFQTQGGDLFAAMGLENLMETMDGGRATEPGASGGAGAGFNYQEQYGVIVICESEAEQKRVYDKLVGDGYKVKVVAT